jgi:hypothetical protein
VDLLLCLKQGVNRRMVLCDVTVVHSLGAGYLASAARNSGYAACVAQKAKSASGENCSPSAASRVERLLD